MYSLLQHLRSHLPILALLLSLLLPSSRSPHPSPSSSTFNPVILSIFLSPCPSSPSLKGLGMVCGGQRNLIRIASSPYLNSCVIWIYVDAGLTTTENVVTHEFGHISACSSPNSTATTTATITIRATGSTATTSLPWATISNAR